MRGTNKSIIRNLIMGGISLVLAVAIMFVPFVVLRGWIEDKPNRVPLASNLAIPEGPEHTFKKEIINIALFGLDTRKNNMTGRSDAIIILSIDKIHNSIKMTSVARDTYIKYKDDSAYAKKYAGKGDKITHAWIRGKANLAVETLNHNFKLNIQDYVAVNFFQFAEIIDYIGGVNIDVNASEMKVMNREYIPYQNDIGIKCDSIKTTGIQRLTGGQALAYARDRYTGNDMARGGRQREVLSAMVEQVKNMSVTKLPDLIEMILERCTTSLTADEMLDIGQWAVFNGPGIENLGLPNDECKSKGEMINGTSYVVYDLENASNILYEFIYQEKRETVSETSSQ